MPVRLPLGRARLVTSPSRTGSVPVVKTTRDEIEPELRTLFYAFDDPYYRERMQSAIDNAVAYASPNKPEKFGEAEKVRTFLLHV